MVMERRSGVGKYFDFEKSQKKYFYQSHSAVNNKYERRRDEEERTSWLKARERQEKTDCPGTGIPHEQTAWWGIKPEITKQTYGQNKNGMTDWGINTFYPAYSVDCK